MDIDVDQRCLGDVDIGALRARILEQDAVAWTEQGIRQQTYEVHKDTESIVMLFCDEEWPQGDIYRESGWDRLADVAMPLMEQILADHYEPGGVVLRAMAANLKPQGRILPHRDSLSSFHIGHRIHLPITTNAGVRYTISGKPYTFEVGKVYEINNQKLHSVMNLGSENRINFIFDYVPRNKLPEDKPLADNN